VQRQVPSSPLFIVSAVRCAIAASVLAVAACGGDSSGPPLTLSGTVSGLTTTGLSLTTLGVNLPVASGATTFTFGAILTTGVVYDVTAPGQPAGQLCTVTNATGEAQSANITNVVVTCSNKTFNVGGTISGLTAAGLVLTNGSDALSVPAGATSFTMPTAVANASSYGVSVTAQPTGLTCDVTNGAGTVTGPVTNIAVACTGASPAVGGSISGLGHATGLVIANGADTYAVPADATRFALDTAEPSGGTYAVRVQSQPTGLTCSASRGFGTIPTHSVTDIAITCSDEAYSLGGTVAGLTGAGLVLTDGDDTLNVPAAATHFTMPGRVASGSSYAVSIVSQPAGLTCTVSRGTGTLSAGAINDIDVTCDSSSFTLGGSISGLRTTGLVLTDGTDDLSVSANAARFSMPKALAYGSDYTVAIKAEPESQACQIVHGSGAVSAEIETVQVICEASAAAP
jgi:hypothetical protein